MFALTLVLLLLAICFTNASTFGLPPAAGRQPAGENAPGEDWNQPVVGGQPAVESQSGSGPGFFAPATSSTSSSELGVPTAGLPAHPFLQPSISIPSFQAPSGAPINSANASNVHHAPSVYPLGSIMPPPTIAPVLPSDYISHSIFATPSGAPINSANATTSAGNPADTNSVTSSLCPILNNQIYNGGVGLDYTVLCDTAFAGDTITTISKRQDASISDSDCMAACDPLDECIAIMVSEGSCFLFSSVDDTLEYEGATCAKKIPGTAPSSSSSTTTVEPTWAVSSGIPHNSVNDTAAGYQYPTGGIWPTGHFPIGTGLTRPATIPLVTVSGGYIPINANFSGPYVNPHCPGNSTHVHHGTEPCDCVDDEPTPLPSSGFPINSANATATPSVPITTSSAAPGSSGGFSNSANATTSAFMTGTGYHWTPPVTTVPLISVSGGYIPINHNFTVPYFNPHCPGNATHVHHGTEPCDCIDDEPAPTPGPSSGFPVNSANSTTTATSPSSSAAEPVPKPSSGFPVNSANSTTSRSITGTAPQPTAVSLTSISGGYIPINHNFTIPYYNPHCPNNPNHVHHGTEPCDCVDEPTAAPSSGFPVNSANATTTSMMPGTGYPRPTTVALTSVSGGYIPVHQNFTMPYVNTHCPDNPNHVHHGTEPCDCVDAPTAGPSSGFPVNSANATATSYSVTMPANTTATATETATATSTVVPLCPALAGELYTAAADNDFAVECDTAFSGDVIQTITKRQSTTASDQDCLASCDTLDECVAVTIADDQCALLSTVDGKDTVEGATSALKKPKAGSVTSTPLSLSSTSSTSIDTTTSVAGNSSAPLATPSLTHVSGGYIPIPANFTLPYINTYCPKNTTHVHFGTEVCDCIDDDEPTPTPTPSNGLSVSASTTTSSASQTAYPGTISESVSMPSPTSAPQLNTSSSTPPVISLTSVSGGYIPIQHNFTGSYINTHCPGNATHVHHGTEPCDCDDDDHLPTAAASLTENASTTSEPAMETPASETSTSSSETSSSASSSAVPTSTYAPVCPGSDGQTFSDDTGVEYKVACDTSYTGTIVMLKRRDAFLWRRDASASAQECMGECDNLEACIAITHAQGQCTLFSDVTGTSSSPGATAAKKVPKIVSSSSSSKSSASTSASVSTTSPPAISLTSVPGGYIPMDPNFTGSYLNTMCAGNHTHVHHGTEPCDCGEDLPRTNAALTGSSTVPTVSASATQPVSTATVSSTSTSSKPTSTSTVVNTTSTSLSSTHAKTSISSKVSTSSLQPDRPWQGFPPWGFPGYTAKPTTSTLCTTTSTAHSMTSSAVHSAPAYTESISSTTSKFSSTSTSSSTVSLPVSSSIVSAPSSSTQTTSSTYVHTTSQTIPGYGFPPPYPHPATSSGSVVTPSSKTSSVTLPTAGPYEPKTTSSQTSTPPKAITSSSVQTTSKATTSQKTTISKKVTTTSKGQGKPPAYTWPGQKPPVYTTPEPKKSTTTSKKTTTTSQSSTSTKSSVSATTSSSSQSTSSSVSTVTTTSSKLTEPIPYSYTFTPPTSSRPGPPGYESHSTESTLTTGQAIPTSTVSIDTTCTESHSTMSSSLISSTSISAITTTSSSATASSSSSTSSSTVIPTPTAPVVCPAYDGKVLSGYSINCDTALSGTVVPAKYERDSVSMHDCMAACNGVNACVAVTLVSGQCSMLSEVNAKSAVPGATAAYKVSTQNISTSTSTSSAVPSTSSASTTSTVAASPTFSTLIKTVTPISTVAAKPTTAPAPVPSPSYPEGPQQSGNQSGGAWWSVFWGNMVNWFKATDQTQKNTGNKQQRSVPNVGRFAPRV